MLRLQGGGGEGLKKKAKLLEDARKDKDPNFSPALKWTVG